MTELEKAEEALAWAEDFGGPYAEQNIATHRARVARLQEAALQARVTAKMAAMPPAPKTPPPAEAIDVSVWPKLTGTREQRLKRLASAMGARPETLEKALKDGTSPDEFVIAVLDDREIDARAREIMGT